MPADKPLVPRDSGVPHHAVQRGDHLHAARPVLRDQRPLDARVVGVGHADEPAAVKRRLAAAAVAEPHMAHDGRVADVELVPVVEELDIREPDRVLPLDAELQHQPVRHVDKIFIQNGQAAHDGRLSVVPPVHIGSRIVHAVCDLPLRRGDLPLRRTPGAQVAVAGGGQRLAKPLRSGIETLVAEQVAVHGTSSSLAGGHDGAIL